jgi:hypothetical protein
VSLLAGCATVTDVVPTGPDTFLVASQGVIGNGSAATQLVQAMQSANRYCAASGKQAKQAKQVSVQTMDAGFGRAPGATVQFQCV